MWSLARVRTADRVVAGLYSLWLFGGFASSVLSMNSFVHQPGHPHPSERLAAGIGFSLLFLLVELFILTELWKGKRWAVITLTVLTGFDALGYSIMAIFAFNHASFSWKCVPMFLMLAYLVARCFVRPSES